MALDSPCKERDEVGASGQLPQQLAPTANLLYSCPSPHLGVWHRRWRVSPTLEADPPPRLAQVGVPAGTRHQSGTCASGLYRWKSVPSTSCRHCRFRIFAMYTSIKTQFDLDYVTRNPVLYTSICHHMKISLTMDVLSEVGTIIVVMDQKYARNKQG